MAIRGPKQNELQHTQRPARQQPASPLQRLMDFGAARTPAEAKKLVSELLAGMRAAGFPVPKAANTDAELSQALKLFQKDAGLPESGLLDKETFAALKDAGMLGGANEAGSTQATTSDKPARFDLDGRKLGGELGFPRAGDGTVPEGAKSAVTVELEQLVDKSARDKQPEVDLKSFLASLRQAGFPGGGKGADQLKDALKKLQKAEGLPQTGHLDQKTAEALVKRGIVDARALPVTTKQEVEAARTHSADAKSDPASTRGAPQADASPSTARADNARDNATSSAAAQQSESASSQAASSSSQAADGASTAKESSDANGTSAKNAAERSGDVDDPWSLGEDGNAPAGDEDVDDVRRGHANIVDEDEDHEEGHWEVAPLAEQIEAGLAAIVRDDDGTGAASYAWDFTLYRPGTYGKKQPAEKLFHLVVSKASAFDALWQKACAALNSKVAQYEADSGFYVDDDDFQRALRVARYRT